MDDRLRKRVEAATVQLPKLGGMGVLVRGAYVATAARCIDWRDTKSLSLARFYLEPIVTADGEELQVRPIFADPLSDLAVLAALDDQVFPAKRKQFEAWAAGVETLPLSDEFEAWCQEAATGSEQTFRVHCLAHDGVWVPGSAGRIQQDSASGSTEFTFSAPIKGGSSGCPIVDDSGALVGVMSEPSREDTEQKDVPPPIAAFALPHWLLNQIRRGGV